jgi:arylsulfatase A-like enzyme
LELLDPDGLSAYTSSLPEHGVDLRPSWDLELDNPEEDSVDIELRFGGRLIRPAPSDVLDNYQTEVDYTDYYIGEIQKLFESFGIVEEVLWVVVSDHGEGLFNHGVLGHAEFTFEDQLRILWLLNGPSLPAGAIVDEPALMEDVAPTLLDIVGLPIPESAEGMVMASCWSEGDCPIRDEWWSYGMRHEPSQLTSLAGHKWPYKWQWRRGEGRQAFALLEDPWEEKDLLELPGPERPDDIKVLAEDFRRQRARHQNLVRQRPDSGDPERRMELLRSLGYVDPKQQ